MTTGPPVRVHVGEHRVACAHVPIEQERHVVGDRGADVVRIHRGGIAHDHELLGMRYRKRAQHERVDERENRRIGADAECERGDDRECEGGPAFERSNRIAQIAQRWTRAARSRAYRGSLLSSARRRRTRGARGAAPPRAASLAARTSRPRVRCGSGARRRARARRRRERTMRGGDAGCRSALERAWCPPVLTTSAMPTLRISRSSVPCGRSSRASSTVPLALLQVSGSMQAVL